MLTKQLIISGDYLLNFGHVPEDILWPLERIEQSMHDTMKERPTHGDFWIFAYGSLIWNPLLNFAGQQVATLQGWHRSFCLRMIAGRATMDIPGRMLALEPGGATQGIAYRLTEAVAEAELILLWVREMPTGAYQPVWTEIELEDGSEVTALVFVAEPDHPLYESDSAVESIVDCITSAEGPMGSNADYVHKLCSALSESGIADEYIGALSAEIMF
ncbi:gamma-glutamylcyclotransferase [Pseudomonas gingeri]|uniref:gamma-glutamylcyclotransferase n=1 Tax=Pseudomonas gingeri TaxID=117681 RepID=UPI0015A033F0|nr:gamma-glutamylcyclotransferase [Pseudomonas gingeri]NWA24914.1 gamma-glutamylcyclotransferase [Pseudomonas gingeri]NWD71745.1 gamma-glutamylcyclotransferase [Pseudomonas gingeri]NWD74923.1 gamma-glutamylcyclotransferase [Pseudomonas gingeri]